MFGLLFYNVDDTPSTGTQNRLAFLFLVCVYVYSADQIIKIELLRDIWTVVAFNIRRSSVVAHVLIATCICLPPG